MLLTCKADQAFVHRPYQTQFVWLQEVYQNQHLIDH